jgi:hypothetical protein
MVDDFSKKQIDLDWQSYNTFALRLKDDLNSSDAMAVDAGTAMSHLFTFGHNELSSKK